MIILQEQPTDKRTKGTKTPIITSPLQEEKIERYKLFFRFMNGEISEPIFKIEQD